MTRPTVVVRPVVDDDRPAWERLFAGYRTFYEMPEDPATLATVWEWLRDPGHPVGGLVAEVDGEIVGLAHHRRYARPSEGGYGTWLDDLFTLPQARGRGVARALIEAVTELASARGDQLVRWITDDDNSTARRLYDDLAVATRWVTYDRAIG
ncbi:GNAT family N-acetyltransferase [Nocardioides sp. LHG3406-4]|uniref:GNAT family N-acetyltransferase n=1 Tax=Nocardioides sp. LHG3406-4 TaxID=2804575 RepID=UPI003CF9FB1E